MRTSKSALTLSLKSFTMHIISQRKQQNNAHFESNDQK